MNAAQKKKLVQAFQHEFQADVESEKVALPGRYRFAVVSQKFARMPHHKRQDQLWSIASATLPREAMLDISLILAFAPNELEDPKAYADRPGRARR